MSASKSFIERRKDAYYEGMQIGDRGKILAMFSDAVQYSDILFNVLNMNKAVFAGFVAAWFGGMESLAITPGPIAGNEDFVAMEWEMEFVSKQDNATFNTQQGVPVKLKGVSLVWYTKEGGDSSFEEWKVIKVKDYSSVARGE